MVPHESCGTNDLELVYFILKHVAENLGYSNVRSLIEYHLKFLFRMWLQSKKALAQFPIHLCEASDLTQFLDRYLDVLLPEMVLMRDKASLMYVAGILHKDAKDLIKFGHC